MKLGLPVALSVPVRAWQLTAVVVLLAMLALSGCASGPRDAAGSADEAVRVNVSGLPQTLLAGARLPQARSVAMANARTKGWSVREAHQNQVLLERPLPRESLQALGLGADAIPPLAQVQTNLVEQNDGVIVGLRSFIIKNPGSSGEQRLDATANFHDDLLASLASLQTAWATTRTQLAREMPRPSGSPAAAPALDDLDGDRPTEPRTAAVSDDVQVRAPAPLPEQRPTPAPAPVPTGAPTGTPTGTPARPGAPATTVARTEPAGRRPPATLAPVESRTPARAPGAAVPLGGTTTTSPLAAAEPAAQPIPQPIPPLAAPSPAAPVATTLPPLLSTPDTPVGNDMLVLNPSARKGLWAYYAEDYARLRGCAVGALGAVLLQEAATYELHEVHCDGSNNFLLRCQGGVCQETR